uniref:Uncharacterized protein n=2 Tax=Oryza TaxID=4527 RepID=A0A0D3GZ46_9ORYZ
METFSLFVSSTSQDHHQPRVPMILLAVKARRILGWPAPTQAQPMLRRQHSAQNECRREGVDRLEHKPPECVKGKENARPQRLLRVRIRIRREGVLRMWG